MSWKWPKAARCWFSATPVILPTPPAGGSHIIKWHKILLNAPLNRVNKPHCMQVFLPSEDYTRWFHWWRHFQPQRKNSLKWLGVVFWLEGKSPSHMFSRSLINRSFGLMRLTSSLSLWCSCNDADFEGYSLMPLRTAHTVVNKCPSQFPIL